MRSPTPRFRSSRPTTSPGSGAGPARGSDASLRHDGLRILPRTTTRQPPAENQSPLLRPVVSSRHDDRALQCARRREDPQIMGACVAPKREVWCGRNRAVRRPLFRDRTDVDAARRARRLLATAPTSCSAPTWGSVLEAGWRAEAVRLGGSVCHRGVAGCRRE